MLAKQLHFAFDSRCGPCRYVGNGDDQDGWSTVAPMSKIRGSLALSFLGGIFYAIGGGIPSEQYSLVEGYAAVLLLLHQCECTLPPCSFLHDFVNFQKRGSILV